MEIINKASKLNQAGPKLDMPFKPLIELARKPDFSFRQPERVLNAMWAMPGVEKLDLKSQVIWRFDRHGFVLNFTYFEDHRGQPHMRVMASKPGVYEGKYFIGGFQGPKGIDLMDIQPGKHVQLVLDGNHRLIGGTEDVGSFERKTSGDTDIVLEKSQEVAATKATVKEFENLLRRIKEVSEKRKGAIFPEEPKIHSSETPLILLFRFFVKEKQDQKTLELIRKAKKHVLSLLEHVGTKPLR